MKSPWSIWRLMFVSLLALLLAACKPYASFEITPDPVTAGVEARFDASGSSASTSPRNNTLVSYGWDFGDGTTGTGKTATHTFAEAGTYTVKLTVIDTAGRIGTTTERLSVMAGETVDPATTTLRVITQIAGGVSLSGADVSVGGASATSDSNGLATLNEAPVGERQVVIVKKAGYVTQSVFTTLAAADRPQQLLVTLLPEKETLGITRIEQAQTIESHYLGARVTLPEAALVNAATGAPATGAAMLKLTPWDIAGIDLQAMPGNGRALDSAGELVDLVSAGMMTVDFFDTAGNPLQIAQGKSAVIQMNLPAGTTGIGDNAIAQGTNIPLWHFDEARGLWIGEGAGVVVATSTGLAVSARVRHFSTWNWDYVTRPIVGGAGSSAGSASGPPATTPTLTLSCADANNALTACSVVATVYYPNGSSRFWSANLPAAVSPVQNMPEGTTISWTAKTLDGQVGSTTSPSTGNVVIRLRSPLRHFVRCLAPGNVPTACLVAMSTTLVDGTTATLNQYVPDSGATILSDLDTTGPLSWTASTGLAASGGGTWTAYAGSATSGISGNVDIDLAAETVSAGKTIWVSCLPNTRGTFYPSFPLVSCSIQIAFMDLETITVASGLNGPVAVTLPAFADDVQISITAAGGSDQPLPGNTSGFFSANLGDLQDNQQIEIELDTYIFQY